MDALGTPVFIFSLVAVAIVALIVWGAMQSAKRRKELAAWAAARGLRFNQAKDRGMESRFPDCKALRQGDDRYAYNVIQGDWSGRAIVAFDYHYETHSHDSKGHRQTQHHHFSAVALASRVPLKALFIRAEGFFDKITEFFGADDIDFESAEFSRKFFIKADDRRWAYDVIHARTMKFLLDSPRFTIQFGRDYAIAWRGAKFRVPDFEAAVGVIGGVLDRLPEYLVKQQSGQA